MASIDGLDDETRDPQAEEAEASAASVRDVLTIVAHPDIDRVGEVAELRRARVELSRKGPLFAPVRGGESRPLAVPSVSRRPVTIARSGDAVTLDSESPATVDKKRLESLRFTDEEVETGIIIELSTQVAVMLHRREATIEAPADLGLIGEHASMHRLRREVLRLASLDVPILLRGATGTGKELVARAIHATGPRAEAPCVAVNMAAVQASVAAAELFGHAKGAFTGAVDDRDGFFARADGGTLFLDEIGEASIEVQVMLLRTLETQTIQPVGAHDERAVSVRLIAATDANLDAAVRAGRFRPALVHRLAGYELHIPRLAERREDIARLVAHFYRDEAAKAGAPKRNEDGDRIWLPAAIIARLVRYEWPGNVRQLRNVTRRLALAAGDGPAAMDALLDQILGDDSSDLVRDDDAPVASRKPADVTNDELEAAMKNQGYRLERAANELGISRASLYRLVEAHPSLRTAKDLSDDELRRARDDTGGDLEAMSKRLGVSVSGIRLRLKQL